MPPLNPVFFRDGEKVHGRDLARAEIAGFNEVSEALARFKWSGKLTACTVLGLSTDNKRVTGASLCLAGPLEDRDAKIEISKLWPSGKANVTLILRDLEGSDFTFGEGGMYSDLLQDDEVGHFYSWQPEDRAPLTVLQADYETSGIKRFCIRMNCHLSKSSSAEKGVFVRFKLLIFPGTKEELTAKSPLVRRGEWPGIKLSEGEIQLGPIVPVNWGCPILPLLVPGTKFALLGTAPSSDKLRRAVAGVMRKAVVPETSRTGASLQTKWDHLVRHPEASGAKAPEVTWPEPEAPAQETGREKRFFLLFFWGVS